MALAILIFIVIAFIAALIFVRFVRALVAALIRFAFLIIVILMAAAGIAMLMNNETIFERPGTKARLVRFLTVDSAATSENGDGDAPCMADKHAAEAKAQPAEEGRHPRGKKKEEVAQAAAQPTATPAPEAAEENFYDELVTRNYICEGDTPVAIPRAKLIEMATQTVNELKGWKLLSVDQRTGILTCLYTSRVFGFEDDIKIVVTPRTDIELCSQSKKGEPDSTSLLRFFGGDFGANIGHIKEFYATLKPRTDQYCKELQEKQKPKGSQ